MGNEFQIPKQVNDMPKNLNNKILFVIQYCNSCYGRPQANYANRLIKTVFPNCQIKAFSPGMTGNLKILLGPNKKQAYNRMEGDQSLGASNAGKFMQRIRGMIKTQYEQAQTQTAASYAE